MEHHPCGICGVHVLETDEAVQCDGPCSLWHHRECLGMTLAEYLKLSKGHEDWICRKCTVKREIKQEADTLRRRRQQHSDMGKTAKVECKKLEALTGTQKCGFCNRTDIDEMKYGPIYMYKKIITHYYCLLLSSNMEQNGRDCDGILGFLPNDIQKEMKRGVRLYCSFCRAGGATLGCAIAKCKVVFHLPCGMKHGTLHQFFGEFKSYCAKHRPVQKISEKILAESSKNAMCGICYEKVVPRPIHETLWAPCCQKSAFFHRDCVQKLATSAGYFFKCPLCNNTSTFQKEMKEFGIYIPEQDASWECVPNAYQDLLVRHDMCDSASCSCPSGRKTNNQGTRWELILCKFCGSQGIHIGCGRLKWRSPEFVCDICAGNNAAEYQEANTRNYQGNRHRLSGTGRAAEIHPSVSADREADASDRDSSDEDTKKVTISNRRRRIISPPPSRTATPTSPTPPRVETPIKRSSTSDQPSKKLVSSSTIIINDAPKSEFGKNCAIVIDDSDDEIEVVSETKGSCLKTKDGSTIPVVQMRSVKKRLNIEGDVNVLPEEIVDITIQMQGPPKKKSPTPPVEEVVYSLPTPAPSTSYCPPSTSFAPPPDVTKFVLVDPSTFRPEDLPPGTVLYRSLAPMVTIPQSSVQPQQQPQPQPQVQQIPTSQVPMPQLGWPRGRCSDAKHPDLSEHRRRNGHHIHPAKSAYAKTHRADKHNRTGRRRRRGCDNDRLKPLVLVSPLKCRISNDGFFEILLPRRNLGFGFGPVKRKASPLPSRPLKKMKLSSELSPDQSPKKIRKNKKKTKESIKKDENKKVKKTRVNKSVRRDLDEKLDTNYSNQITMFFSPEKLDDEKKKNRKSANERKLKVVETEKGNATHLNSSPKDKTRKFADLTKRKGAKTYKGNVSRLNCSSEDKIKIRKKKKVSLLAWKFKKIDEYLEKINSESTVTLDQCSEETSSSSELIEDKPTAMKSILNEIIEYAVLKCISDDEPTDTSIETSDTCSLNISNETKSSEENDSQITESKVFLENNVAHEVNAECKNSAFLAVDDNTVENIHSQTELTESCSLSKTKSISGETDENVSPDESVVFTSQDTMERAADSSKIPVSIEGTDNRNVCKTITATTNICFAVDERSVNDGKEGSLLGEVEFAIPLQKENVPQIPTNTKSSKCTIKMPGLFPKIKPISKINRCYHTKKKTFKKLQTESETKIKIRLKTKDKLKNGHYPKIKKKILDKVSPVNKMGAIEKYFTSVKKDHCFSPPKCSTNLNIINDKSPEKEKIADSFLPSPASLDNDSPINDKSPKKEKIADSFLPSPALLDNNSPQKNKCWSVHPDNRPLVELQFN